jgi:hypothetical protein
MDDTPEATKDNLAQWLNTEYGSAAAAAVFRSVHDKTGRLTLDEAGRPFEVTSGDLELLHQELQQPQYQELKRQHQELPSLRDRVTYDTPEVAKNDLVQSWTSTIEKHYGPKRDAKGGGLALVRDYMQGNTVQFDKETGTLKLTQGIGGFDRADMLNKSAALEAFIVRHCGVKADDPAVQNIASNILSYVPRGMRRPLAQKMMDVSQKAAPPAGYELRSTFTLSAKAGNVVVVGDTSVPFTRNSYLPKGAVDYSKYRFVRHERFEISGANLKSEPRAFNAAANVVPAGRVDTIELAEGAAPPRP